LWLGVVSDEAVNLPSRGLDQSDDRRAGGRADGLSDVEVPTNGPQRVVEVSAAEVATTRRRGEFFAHRGPACS